MLSGASAPTSRLLGPLLDENQLPQKAFISHSFESPEVLDNLLAALPDTVEPVIPSFVRVGPDDQVSDTIVRTIGTCSGLIFSVDAATWRSFWVPFERSVAARLGLSLVGFHPETRHFHDCDEGVAEVHIVALYAQEDASVVEPILVFMEQERGVHAAYRVGRSSSVDFNALERSLRDVTARRGYTVAFLSRRSLLSSSVRQALGLARSYGVIIYALLEPMPITLGPAPYTQLYSCDTLSMTNLVDNLVARLCWLVARNSINQMLKPQL